MNSALQRNRMAKRTMIAKRKAVANRIQSLERAIAYAQAYLNTGKHGDWAGFRPLFFRKLKDGKELPPTKDWVRKTFLPRMEKALRRAEIIMDQLGSAGGYSKRHLD